MVEAVIIVDRIDRFVGEHSFLNNFHPSTLLYMGRSYPTVEHAYQAYKAPSEDVHEVIRRAKGPMEAKKLGKSVVLPDDWDSRRVSLMKKLLTAKFENPFLRELLKGTGDAELIHDNRFNDRCWGICRGSGENWLGRLLKEVRSEVLIEDAQV